MGENQPKGKHLMMAIGALWKQLTPEDKRPFEEMAAALKLAKQEEMGELTEQVLESVSNELTQQQQKNHLRLV